MAAKTRAKTKPANPRSASAGDKALGEKIRARRILARMSQAELGDHVGVSFQQVQKYEKGVNKVGAVRLGEIADRPRRERRLLPRRGPRQQGRAGDANTDDRPAQPAHLPGAGGNRRTTPCDIRLSASSRASAGSPRTKPPDLIHTGYITITHTANPIRTAIPVATRTRKTLPLDPHLTLFRMADKAANANDIGGFSGDEPSHTRFPGELLRGFEARDRFRIIWAGLQAIPASGTDRTILPAACENLGGASQDKGAREK